MCRNETVLVEGHCSEIVHRDAIDVLTRCDCLERRSFVDVCGYWVLQQNAVHSRVLGQRFDFRDELGGGGLGREFNVARLDPSLGAPIALHLDVGVRGGIVADQHGREAGTPTIRFDELGCLAAYVVQDLRGYCTAVDDVCVHVQSSR
ncbi:hypothetical protein M2405_004177 [Rhodococcus erythropolis]|nr:hypothetical protein [Rhodococcus erythropolis]MCW2425391.1 hypothetical protein [Rhodococcus erythropolis]